MNWVIKIMAFAFGLAAEIERDLISKRTKEALAKRKQAGLHLGRIKGSKNKKYKLDSKKDYIQEQLGRGIPKYKIAKHLNVCPRTLNKFIVHF